MLDTFMADDEETEQFEIDTMNKLSQLNAVTAALLRSSIVRF
jgi:hypothetical protein